MKRWIFLGAGLLAPSVSWASGDVGLAWKAFAGFAIYVAVGGLLVVFLVQRRIAPWRLVGFLAAATLAWWWFGNLRPPFRTLDFCALLLVPICFLIGIRGRPE